MLWDDVSFVLGSPLAKKILIVINESKEPIAPVQISKLTKIQRTNVSKKLIPLVEKKLVICVNPESRKWRFYEITPKGREVLEKLNRMQ
ncbi:MAG: hypothetical protein HYW23_04180 [Candidatus Aenigmarchaeota archaeon]|nr:hypothetical protein [Candidatus Aenigmarchaeota archaeon]